MVEHASDFAAWCVVHIPDGLKWLQEDARGKVWLPCPSLVSDLVRAWELDLGAPFEKATVSYVVPAIRGTERVVLKVQWPHEECAYEADALRIWDGDGAVRLLAQDENRQALLLEHCRPGTALGDAKSVDPIAVVIDLLPRLWKPAGPPFKSLSTEAKEWSATLYSDWEAAGRLCERRWLTLQQSLSSNSLPARERAFWSIKICTETTLLLRSGSLGLQSTRNHCWLSVSFHLRPSSAASSSDTHGPAIKRLDRLSLGLALIATGFALGPSRKR